MPDMKTLVVLVKKKRRKTNLPRGAASFSKLNRLNLNVKFVFGYFARVLSVI